MKNKTHKVLRNTKNKTCKSKNWSVCCPHMPPINGKYAATTKRHRLKYLNKHYYFKTCCNQCAKSMKHLSLSNPKLFKKLYINKKTDNCLLLKNRFTKKFVQKAFLVKK